MRFDAFLFDVYTMDGGEFCKYFSKLWSFIYHHCIWQSSINWGPAHHNRIPNESVVILARNLAALKRVASSTRWRTGWPSRYTISMYTLELKRTFWFPIDTRKRIGAFRIRWHGSHLATISFNRSSVSLLTASSPARFKRLYNFVAEGCANCLCILFNWAVV